MTDATPLHATADKIAAAKAKQEARERGIAGQAKAAGRKEREEEIFQALGVQRLEDASTSAQLRAERDARPTRDEELKHGRHRFYQGMVVGALVFTAVISGVWAFSASTSFRQASDYGARMVVSGAALDAAREPGTCIPGSTRPDGTICGESQR